MNDCRDQLDGRWNDGRAARWAGVDLLGCDEDGVAIEHAGSAAATKGQTMTQDNEEPSAASAGYAKRHLMERRQQVTRLRKPESAPEVRGRDDLPVTPLLRCQSVGDATFGPTV